VTQANSISSTEIQAELERIVASEIFAASDRMKRFLRFVVDATLEGKGDELSEFVIGVGVYERGENFDPRIDSIVRVDASRLRSKLREDST